MRWKVLVWLVMAGALSGCGREWITSSARFVPNPVLIGPVQRVRGASSAAVISHELRDAEGPIYSKSTSTSTSGLGTESQSTLTITHEVREGGFQLGTYLLDAALANRLLGALWPEEHRATDIVRFDTLHLGAFQVHHGGLTSGQTYEGLTIACRGMRLIHVTPPAAVPQ